MSSPPASSRDLTPLSTWLGSGPRQIIIFGGASLVLFAAGLELTEGVGEILTDIDLKPFFIPYILIALVRYPNPTLSIGLGAALGEGLLDVAEGYELEDPIGFIGYVVGFTVFGWYLHRVASDPGSRRAQVLAAIFGALVQATFEGLAFLAIATDANLVAVAISIAGNTITHGVLLGAIPLVLLYPPLVTRLSRVSDEDC